MKKMFAHVGFDTAAAVIATKMAEQGIEDVIVVDANTDLSAIEKLYGKKPPEDFVLRNPFKDMPLATIETPIPKALRGREVLPIQPRNKVSRNALCPCGSGLKFKRCCKK